jgi:hypothetical protein
MCQSPACQTARSALAPIRSNALNRLMLIRSDLTFSFASISGRASRNAFILASRFGTLAPDRFLVSFFCASKVRKSQLNALEISGCVWLASCLLCALVSCGQVPFSMVDQICGSITRSVAKICHFQDLLVAPPGIQKKPRPAVGSFPQPIVRMPHRAVQSRPFCSSSLAPACIEGTRGNRAMHSRLLG